MLASTSRAEPEVRVEYVDGTSYVLALERVSVKNLNALFGGTISFLELDHRPVMPTPDGHFQGLAPGRTYLAIAADARSAAPRTSALRSSRDMDALEERTEVLKVFRRFDSNKSGDIDIQEFSALIKELGRDLVPEEIREIFTLIDTDKSGVIDFSEFYSWYTGSKRSAATKTNSKAGRSVLDALRTFGTKLVESPSRPTQVSSTTVELHDVASSSPNPAATSAAAAATAGSSSSPRASLTSQRGAPLQAAWQAVTFADGWRAPAADSGLRPAEFAFLGSTVALRGCAIATGTTVGTVFTLPATARPAMTERFIALKAGNHPKAAMVTVNPDGTVAASALGEIWFSGISFIKA